MSKLIRYSQFIDSISDWTGKIVAFLLLGLTGVVLFGVVMRYIFNDPTIWGYEMGQYLFGAIITLGAAYTLLHKGHVTMDVVYGKLSPRMRATMDAVTFIFFFLFVVVLLWKGWDMTWKAIKIMERSQSVWAPVIWPSRLVIPVGAFLLLLQGLSKFFRDMSVATGREKP